MPETKKPASGYKAEQIKVLEGLEGVRRRPAMYIGGTGKDGLHHLVYEVVDNSIDEALAGHCDLIVITIRKDGGLTVSDNGRGIPTGVHPKYKKPALEIALTKLHAGGKFEKSAYEISGGLHGVGVSCVNALSIKLIAKICRSGKICQQEYKIGKPKYAMKTLGKCKPEEHGTEITFYPDPEIFSTLDFDFAYLKKRIQEIAFLNPNVKIVLKEEKTGKKEIFHYEGGLMEFVKHINKSKTQLHKPIYFKREDNGNIVEVAIQYTESYNENIFGFVNTINTTEGGTHISGFKTALTRSINDYASKKNLLKNIKIEGNDTREGITAIISLKMKEPQFEGQTKTKLGNSDMKGIVDSMVYTALTEFLEENPSVSNKIAQKALASSKARVAAKKARDLVRRKSAIGGLSGLPGKLTDCSSKKTEKTELYIVEGDSAAGTAVDGRDREFQAVLPLKGKILNVEKSNPTKALSSDEIINLITAIGTGVKENFDIKKLRYSKIIIMTDADVDGQHISTLLLTFFFRYVPELIENGNIYVAVSPLYRVRKKKAYYVYSDDELKKLVAKLGGKADVQRFKGLGEMNSEQLWDTTMNPKTRILKKVNIEDAVLADETFTMLMGDVVGPRRKFIEMNANIAEVDI
jgi:DNA gyrase subunit B